MQGSIKKVSLWKSKFSIIFFVTLVLKSIYFEFEKKIFRWLPRLRSKFLLTLAGGLCVAYSDLTHYIIQKQNKFAIIIFNLNQVSRKQKK